MGLHIECVSPIDNRFECRALDQPRDRNGNRPQSRTDYVPIDSMGAGDQIERKHNEAETFTQPSAMKPQRRSHPVRTVLSRPLFTTILGYHRYGSRYIRATT